MPVATSPVATISPPASASVATTVGAGVKPNETAAIAVSDLPSVPSAPTEEGAADSPNTKGGRLSAPALARAAATAVDPAESERAEVALLDAAQRSLASNPAEALRRCDEHAKTFASGTLVQEREVLAIDALLRLGRRADADARAARFRRSFPRSGHLRRIDALLDD
jgi:hypothetical protein